MSLLARLRRLLARRPWLYWAAVGAVALLIGLQVQAALAAVDHARRDWGTPVTVWVATAPAGAATPSWQRPASTRWRWCPPEP